MHELQTSSERCCLLPGKSRELFVVLFWRSSDPSAASLRDKCCTFAWPRCFRTVSIDLDEAREIDDWFNIKSPPMLAVVHDGALLSMEFDFCEAAYQRLAECGRHQYSQLRDSLA